MKSVGVIGGLGPETTAEFYLEVIFGCQKRDQIQRPSVIIASVPLLYEIENDLIARNFGKERYVPFLTKEAKRLEKAGADFLVMPCNSLHVFIKDIRLAVKIPVISIVEETISYLMENNFKKVGLISTSATITNKVYEVDLSKNNIEYVTPNELQRAKMNKIIQRLVAGQHLNKDREEIQAIVDELTQQKVDCVALACTDLQLLLPKNDEVEVFDTMKILSKATVERILS